MQENPNSNLDVIPIETRIRTLNPVCSGLYPHEILALSYANKFTTSHKSYAGFWSYKYGIDDMATLIDSLHERGYITVSSLKETMNRSTVPFLKSLLNEYGLKAGRKKIDIIHCLIENVPESTLEEHFPEKTYVLTDKGADILGKEEHIPYIHKHNIADLDIWNLSKIIHKNPSIPFKNAIWNYLEHSCECYLKNNQYSLYRNYRFNMAELLIEEDLFDNALILLFEVVYYDLSGSNDSRLGSTAFLKSHDRDSLAFIPKGILSRIKTCKEKLSITDDELKEKMIVSLSGSILSFHIFSLDECADILLFEIQENLAGIEKIYEAAQEKYKNNHPEEYDAMIKRHASMEGIRNDLIAESKIEDSIYNPEWEKEIEERLSKLDELSKKEFYRMRDKRSRNEDVLSSKELDRLTLEAMERSFHYRNN